MGTNSGLGLARPHRRERTVLRLAFAGEVGQQFDGKHRCGEKENKDRKNHQIKKSGLGKAPGVERDAENGQRE